MTEDKLSVDWMDLLSAPLAVLELLSCRCNGSCSSNRCSCFANKLPCTDACFCGDTCENRVTEDFIGGGSVSEDDLLFDNFSCYLKSTSVFSLQVFTTPTN